MEYIFTYQKAEIVRLGKQNRTIYFLKEIFRNIKNKDRLKLIE